MIIIITTTTIIIITNRSVLGILLAEGRMLESIASVLLCDLLTVSG